MLSNEISTTRQGLQIDNENTANTTCKYYHQRLGLQKIENFYFYNNIFVKNN